MNATIALLKRLGLLADDFAGDVRACGIIAHVYDVCVRNSVGRGAIERELDALVREHAGDRDARGSV